MKKIALITASILALGAASIAAGADGLSTLPDTTSLSLGPISAASIETGGEGVGVSTIERKIRLVTSSVQPVKSCDAANWPYYPADCLTKSDPAGL